MDDVFLLAFPFFVLLRLLDLRQRPVGRKGERGREARRRDLVLVFVLFFILVSDFPDGGRGGTDDSDSRAKSYSFGPSTTWPRHNRVKVASCLSPRGGFRSARKVEKGEKGGNRVKKKKHLTRAE